MIQIKRFEKHYKRQTIQFSNLSFYRGINIILGANGSGKTTLLEGLAKLSYAKIEPAFDKDTLFIESEPYLPPFMRAKDYLDCIYEMGNKGGFNQNMLVFLFALEAHLDKRVYQLSKGTRYKLYLLGALFEKKEVFLYDEPFHALDDLSVKALIALWQKQTSIIIASSHDLRGLKNQRVIRL